MKKKTVALLLALALVFGGAVGGTIAWLTDVTSEVKNTFTTAGIGITLIETKNPDGAEVAAGVTNWSAQLVPGASYSKNPKVTVEDTTDVDIYLFVKFEETGKTDILDYTSNLTKEGSGWTKLADVDNVWYREVGANDATKSWELLENNTVAVKDTLTDDAMTEAGFEAPALKYTAYAIQKDGFTTAKAAWDEVSKLPTT